MGILKKPYEISLWEDILTFIYQDGTETEGSIENGHGPVINQYYKERKICIIGSDTMDTPIRATQPKLVSKVNGENILTFNMYSHYYDTTTEEFYSNPFIGLLINERKIKLRYGELGAEDTKWYDLIIKNIQENSDSKTYSYTAKDLYVNELSKSGFNLIFDQELENNMGNIETLAEYILDESDWELRSSGEVLKQTIEEPLYYIQLTRDITLGDMEGNNPNITLNSGTFVYAFYNNIVNQERYVQFLYAEKYEIDDDYIITNSPNWFLEGVTYNTNGIPDFTDALTISSEYRGKRLVRKIKTKYDSTIDKYVNVYNKGAIYGYSETEYLSPATIRSYVTNPNSYDSYTGWEIGCSSDNVFPKLNLVSVPDVRDMPSEEVIAGNINFNSCLKLEVSNTEQLLYNSGIIDMRQHINGFTAGDQYAFRIKYGVPAEFGEKTGNAKSLKTTDIKLTLKVSKYKLEKNGQYKLEDTPYFEYTFSPIANNSTPEYLCSPALNCTASLSYSEMIEMSDSLGLFISMDRIGTVYIEDVQFFPYVETSSNNILLPNEISQSEIKTKYYYYIPNPDYKTIEEVNFVYTGYSPSSEYEEDYNENSYEKIRSITASESNRFNLIQELCEIFECWPKFEIEHDPQTGMIKLDENYRQKKWISFHEYIGQDNYAGFKYGINLKSIQRTIESEGIVSKLIVKNNSNEFATDGFCSIARASENPNGENFILDFSYYIQQGMIGLSEITNDLYLDTNSFLAYYKHLKRINTKRDQYIIEQSGLLDDIAEYTASLQTYNLSASNASKQKRDKLNYIETLTGYTFQVLIENQVSDGTNDRIVEWWNNEQVITTIASIGRLDSVIKNHQALADRAAENLNKAQNRYDLLNRILTSKEKSETEERLMIEKEALHHAFYKKYSRFLQEGSWISEDYIDDNLYYLDAQSTLNTSSKPKITYNISVLELSQLEDYENYTFALGDKTTIEDTEFFGWTWKDGVQTPYQEEIVVTELTIMLDSPELNQIKVQNYKTQFEDLFQRIAATTQSVEYSTGKYQKVAGIIETDGTINITTLQNSIANNALTLQNAKDQSVIWDETGITTTSINNPAEIVRIVSGGVFLSVDGGITWNTGITGKGINASYITSGQMNVEEVNILNGSFPSFRWDKTGISAYEFQLNQSTGEASNFNYGKFVRLDQYGLYGINGITNFDSVVADQDGIYGEDKIWKYSNFALTWRGFKIQSNHGNIGGYISITSDNDFEVINAQGTGQVKIGLLYTDGGEDRNTPIYGIQLKDAESHIVLEHSTEGKVWIRNEIKIGADTSTVSIGYLDATKQTNDTNSSIHEVINANSKFIVYEDGSMIATDGTFTGTIYATGGKIGNLDIQDLQESGFEVAIESDSGNIFKNETGTKILTAYLYKGSTLITEGITGYQWYKQDVLIEGATSQSIEVDASEMIEGIESATYSCAIAYGTAN